MRIGAAEHPHRSGAKEKSSRSTGKGEASHHTGNKFSATTFKRWLQEEDNMEVAELVAIANAATEEKEASTILAQALMGALYK